MAKIDPGHTVFRGAEGTGEAQLLGRPSTFDPVQFMEQNRYADQFARGESRKQKATDVREGLKNLEFEDLKKWDDAKTYENLTKRQRDIQSAYVYLSSPYGKGLNLSIPQTEEDDAAARMMKEQTDQLAGDAQLYMLRGKRREELMKLKLADKEGRIDEEHFNEQMALSMEARDDPTKSLALMEGALRYKPEEMDWIKWVGANIGDYVKLDKSFDFGFDEETGRVTTKTWENYDMAKVKKGLGRMYDNMNEQQHTDWERKHKTDQSQNIYAKKSSPKEYFIQAFTPEQVKKRTGSMGGPMETGAGGSAWPQKDTSGNYVEVPETLTYASETTGEPAEYLSPYTFSLSNLFKTAKDDVPLTTGVNTRLADSNEQLGKPGQSYMSKGQRIVFLPVADQDIPMGYEVGAETVKKGQRLTAEQVDYLNEMAREQGSPYGFTYEPYYDDLTYIKQRMAGGEDDEAFGDVARPVSYNESSYRPYWGQAQNSIKSKFGGELDKSIIEVYEQLKKRKFKAEGILGGAPQKPHFK